METKEVNLCAATNELHLFHGLFYYGYRSCSNSNGQDGRNYSLVTNFSRLIRLNDLKLNQVTHAYEIDGKPILWQYWSTDEVPLFARLLVEAMQCRNPEFRVLLVHDSTIRHYLPKLNLSEDIYFSLSRNHRSDVFRINIMYEYGGAYADVDTFPLDKLIIWYLQLSDYEFVTAQYGQLLAVMGAPGPARARTSIFKLWVEKQLHVISQPERLSDWNILGPVVLTDRDGLLMRNKTKIKEFDGMKTSRILIEVGLAYAAHHLFKDVENKFIPLRPGPYLCFAGAGREIWSRYRYFRTVADLLPKRSTLYSAFVGCALLDCLWKYEALLDKQETGWIDPAEIMSVLRNFDYTVCEKISKRRYA